MSDILLKARGLNSYYGNSHILHGVDFDVKRGESIALMGRNGMGKTTLIRTLLGLVKPKAGNVFLSNIDVTNKDTHQISRMGIAYVPEGRGIFQNLSVRENLIMSERPGQNGKCDWTFNRVLDTFPRLSERLNNGGGQLSGGEQQMLTIGRALMTNPDLLILDEATEGLAPLISREIWRIVREVRNSGIATIVVDKNYAALSEITDRSVILLKGSVVFDGSSDTVRSNSELVTKYLGV